MLPDKLAFTDIETTGGSFHWGRIIEIAIIRVENNKIKTTFSSLVNPHTRIPTEIEQLTGISAHDLEKAPSFYEIKHEIQDILLDRTV